MTSLKVAIIGVVAAMTLSSASAASLEVVRPIPGYKCMMLNLTEGQLMDTHLHIPFYAAPSATGPIAGYASLQVAVKDPAHIVNGFQESLFPTGAIVWIKADILKRYHSLGDPTARCVPSLMSNGRQGFDYPH